MFYRCNGFKPIRLSAEIRTASEAAHVFAARLAQRRYGKRGEARAIRLNSWNQDGTWASFEAFVGYSVKGNPGCTSGRNEWFYVTISP